MTSAQLAALLTQQLTQQLSDDTEATEELYATCQGVNDGTAEPGRFSFLIDSGSILTVDIHENGSYSIV